MAAKKSNKQRKWGRHGRKPCGGKNQAKRTYLNKLRRINRERGKASTGLVARGKPALPPLTALPPTSTAYLKAYPRPV